MKGLLKKILCVVFAVSALALASCGSHDDLTHLSSGRNVLFSGENGNYSLFHGELDGNLKLNNTTDHDMTVYIYSENGLSASVSAAPADSTTAEAVGGELSALRYVNGEADEAYALSAEGFISLLDSGANKITLLENIELDGDMTITCGVSIKCGDKTLAVSGNILFECADECALTLSGNISANNFYARAPMADITVPETLVPDATEYNIVAKSINGEALSGSRVISSESELLDYPDFPLGVDENEAIILRDLELTQSAMWNFLPNITFENAYLNGNLKIETESEGSMTFAGGGQDIIINAPNAALETDTPLELDEAAGSIDVDTYCRFDLKDYALGGEGSGAIISATMTCDGRLMTDDMVWTPDGYVLKALYSGVCAPSVLSYASLTFESENKVEIDPACALEGGMIDLISPFGCYVNVTDIEGKTVKYKIETECEQMLPVVVIETEGGAKIESKEEYIKATVAVESDFSPGLPSSGETEVRIKGRGNSTWKWSDKKPYKIKYSEDTSLLGLNAGKDWVLLANYNDKSLIRNYVALEMAKAMDNMDCYATQYPVDVFLCGEYVGVYSLGEQIEAGVGRIEIEENNASTDSGYLLEVGGDEDAEYVFSSDYLLSVEVHEPDELTDAHMMYIETYVDKADTAIRRLEDYEDYIDVDSLIDWLIVTELTFNSDGALRRSVYIKKDTDGKLEMAAMWDFDLAFGNSNTDFMNYDAWCTMALEYGYVKDNWICSLMEDEEFVSRLTARWNEVKDELYHVTMDAVDYGYEITKNSADDNFKRWDILYLQVAIQPYYTVQYYTHEMQVDFVRDFLSHRFEWLDAQLNPEN